MNKQCRQDQPNLGLYCLIFSQHLSLFNSESALSKIIVEDIFIILFSETVWLQISFKSTALAFRVNDLLVR